MNVEWIHGTRKGGTEPKIQVHWFDERTVILRQSKTVNYEAPFMYLLFGDERALLLDTGATAEPELFPLRETVDALLAERRPERGYGLIVAHSHGHNDHVAADGQFADRPDTAVIGHAPEAVREFFGFGDDWPAATVEFDLGGRVLEILGSPGHHGAAITIFDPRTGLLLTGDTVLPGRLYVFDEAQFVATMDRLVAFAETRPVTHVLGCHVEMRRRPRRVYPLGATYQPDERAPEMTVGQLRAVRDAAHAVRGRRGVHRYDDFLIYNEPRKRDMVALMARAVIHQRLGR
jgi:glyoxylase-like metal-dependent hydrolase (beta-lactamase superfamily II)